MLQAIQEFFISIGAPGMFISAFLAGSFVPFSSELVMIGLLAAGMPGGQLLFWATLGNCLGGVFNYTVGSLGRTEWIARWTKVSPEKLEKGLQKVRRYGVWAGLLAWVPVLGSVFTVSMGFLRTRLIPSVLTICLSKYVRYALIVYLYENAL